MLLGAGAMLYYSQSTRSRVVLAITNQLFDADCYMYEIEWGLVTLEYL